MRPRYCRSADSRMRMQNALLLCKAIILASGTINCCCCCCCILKSQQIIYMYICLSGFHKRCLYWVPRRSSPRSHYSPSPPMKLMTSESLPPSSASGVMIMSHRIDLAGLGHRKTVLLTVKPIIAADNLGKIDKLYGTIFCTVFGLNKSSNEGDNRRLWLLHWS